MRTYIRKLQSKNEDTRKQIFVGSLIVCMSFVAFVWVSNIGSKFDKEVAQKAEESIKPFALFGQSITNTYGNVSASVGNIKKEESKKVEVESEKQIDLIPVDNQ